MGAMRQKAGGRLSLLAPLFTAGLLLMGGMAIHIPILFYSGPLTQHAFDSYALHHLGSYSDISSIYFRDYLLHHPAPYFQYRLEYPVLIGSFIWLVGFVHSSVASYFALSILILTFCALVSVWLIRQLPTSNVWIFAMAPALALESFINWDLFGIALMLTALLAYTRRHDAWGGGLLALATWAKLFPVLLLPCLIAIRLSRREWRQLAAGISSFTLVSVLINAPVALEQTSHGLGLRGGWLYFFRFNAHRPGTLDLWSLLGDHLSLSQINALDTILVVCWVLIVALCAWLAAAKREPSSLLAPGLLSALAFFFLVNKVYSPQYGLWIIALLACAAAPWRLAIPFLAIDLAYYLTSFIAFMTHTSWYSPDVLHPAAWAREALLLAVAIWALYAIIKAPRIRSSAKTRSPLIPQTSPA